MNWSETVTTSIGPYPSSSGTAVSTSFLSSTARAGGTTILSTIGARRTCVAGGRVIGVTGAT